MHNGSLLLGVSYHKGTATACILSVPRSASATEQPCDPLSDDRFGLKLERLFVVVLVVSGGSRSRDTGPDEPALFREQRVCTLARIYLKSSWEV